VTLGVRFLEAKGIAFNPHLYEYRDHGGAEWAAEALSLPPGAVIKTLVFESDAKKPFLVLMQGDREVSAKNLARQLGLKGVEPCPAPKAERLTGYQVGGISPFGIRNALPIYVERSILDLPVIYINGGKRGFLVEIPSAVLTATLHATPVEVGLPNGKG
jgi:Cys-tRNA(Pro) deacylase